MDRCWQNPVDVTRAEIEASLQLYKSLKLTRAEKVAMWIASALHDYGKIFRRGYGLDAEDAAPLCQELVEVLAPTEMQEFVQYGIRNHDLIEHTVTGDTPTCFITGPIEALSADVRPRAMPMLALIQLIGAASLGEGRITKAKMAIYNSCMDGSIVAAGDINTRLGRLLFGGLAVPNASATARAGDQLTKMDKSELATLTTLLEQTVLHGWSAVREQILEQESGEEQAVARLLKTLVLVSKLWREKSPEPTHVVMARPHELVKCTGSNGDDGARLNNEDTSTELLNGAMALILR